MISTLLLVAGIALARPPGPLDEPILAPVETGDTGGFEEDEHQCDTQFLRDGMELPANEALYLRWHPSRSWGRPELVEVITAAAEQVAWRVPGADPIVVGDMSREGGGHLSGHRSHRGGLDADIGLYWGESRQHLHGFMDIPASRLDVATTWALLDAMLETGLVERVLMDQSHIRRLRTYVQLAGIMTEAEAWSVFPQADSPDIWNTEGVVQHVDGHRNHLHVRVRCL